MGYGRPSGAAGKVPEFGAIFMSNIFTKKECFRRKVFGLPLALANFAKQVKPGMILFLFEFERRELFGVFRATSSGAINIVPKAFSLSGSFPAQVRVAPIWFCSPLTEHEFQDAIKENYFSAKKFNFGLSEDQVYRLLCLFSTRKLKEGVPGRQFTRGEIDDDAVRDIVEVEPNFKKVDYDRFSVGNMAEFEDNFNEEDILIDNTGDPRGKKRRIDDEYGALSGNLGENEHFDYHPSPHTLWSEHSRDYLVEERRVARDGFFLTSERLKTKCEMNNCRPLHRVKVAAGDGGVLMNNISVENAGNIGKGETSESRYFLNDRLENEFNLHNSFSSVISTDCSRPTSGEDRLIASDSNFRKNNKDIENFYEPIISHNHVASVYSSKSMEKEYFSPVNRLKKLPVFDRPYHTSYDEVVARTIPYDPEEPNLNYLKLNYGSSPKVKSTPYSSEFESLTRCLDFPLGYGNKVPFPEVLPEFQNIRSGSTPIHVNASNHRDSPSYVTGNALSDTEFTESRLCQDTFSDYIPLPQGETLENENKFVSCSLLESHQEVEYKILGSMSNEVVPRIEISSDIGECRPEAQDRNVQPSFGSMRCDKNNDRKSVFARLTLASKSCIQEQDIRSQGDNKYNTDASVDDCMNFSRQSQKLYAVTRKCKLSARRFDNDENIRMNDFFDIHEQTMISTAMEEADTESESVVNQIIRMSGEPVLGETRAVDFKRRSAIKKNPNEPTTKDKTDNAESDALSGYTEELVGKPCKRRKLVRPDFTKKDFIDESFSSEGSLNLVLPSTSCEGDNAAKTEEKGNSDNCGNGAKAEAESNEIFERLNHLLSKVKSKIVGVGTSNEDSEVNSAVQLENRS